MCNLCGECSVLVFSSSFMYRLEVCLVSLYMLRLRVGVRMTAITWAAS